MPAIKLKEDPVKNKKENSKKWRANIKANPELYKVFCDSEKERVREYRLRRSEEVKSRDRELQREHQRQYRLRKKEKENGTWKKKTRKSADDQREKWRKQKRDSRANLSMQKRVTINKKRRENYAIKKMKIQSPDANVSSASFNSPDTTSTPVNLSAGAKRTARCRYTKKLLQSLPKTRDLKLDVILAGINLQSPVSQKIINDKLDDSSIFRKNLFVSESMTATMKSLRKSRSKRALRKKRLLLEALIVKEKSIKLLRTVGVTRKVARRALEFNLEPGWEDLRKKKGGALSQEQLGSLQNFYNQGDISSEIPNARSALKRDGRLLHRKVITSSLKTTYQQFKEHHPDISISYASFKRHRPGNILPHMQHKFRECLCEYCLNIKLKLKAVNKLSQQKDQALHIGDKYTASKLKQLVFPDSMF